MGEIGKFVKILKVLTAKRNFKRWEKKFCYKIQKFEITDWKLDSLSPGDCGERRKSRDRLYH